MLMDFIQILRGEIILNGNVFVKSRLEQSSAFTIRFNKVEASAKNNNLEKKETEFEMEEKAPTTSCVPQILYVEDDPNSRTVVGLFLKNNYDITIVENAESALDLTNRKIFDLILMDINLGIGMSGLDLAIEIKKKKQYKDVPIAAVTANATIGDKRKSLSNGCSHYIAKPFNKSTIINFIKGILEKSN
ncbi:MAG TPA: response regulator [Ignavibacteria bacterium]|nr:response regulator [Ignavibacteria bacterium]